MSAAIESISMPKWGMTMTQGTLIEWLVEVGDVISVGDEVAEVETEKMLGSVEAHVAGPLRRRVAEPGDVVAVGGLLAVIAPAEVGDAELDAFVEQAAAAAPEPAADDEGPRTLQVEGPLGQVHALVRGEGPEVVLLLHGFGGDALNWRFAIDELAVGRTVIAADLPGHGGSTKEVGEGDLDDLVASVVALLDAEGAERAHLVGHSLGGLVASAMAIRAPERVGSLALISPAGFGEEIDREFLDAFVAASSRRELKVALRKLFADEALVTRQLVEEVLRYKRLDGVPEALGALRDGLFPGGRQQVQLAAELAALDIPLLVVWGSEDQVIPASQAAAAPAAARVEVLAASGHSPHVEVASTVNALLVEHLGAVAAA